MIANADKAEVQVAKEAGILGPDFRSGERGGRRARPGPGSLAHHPQRIAAQGAHLPRGGPEAAEQLLADMEETILEALSEIRSWAPGAEEARSGAGAGGR
jgi:hypothetical protein